jgi:F-type H+-transporting ATPase subunit delta
MKQFTVAHKYAHALFNAAQEEGKLDRVAADAAALLALYRAQVRAEAVDRFLVSPEVPTEEKISFLGTVFGPRMDAMTVNFMVLLVEKKRIDGYPAILEEFLRMVDEHRGLLKAAVLSAIPLSVDQERRLKTQLDRMTGKNVVLEKRVDPGVLGGVEVHLGNQILDGSLRYGLKRLRESLGRTEVN